MAATELGPGLDALEAALRGARLPEEVVLDLRLVAEELVTNLAKYGHDDPAGRWVSVRLAFSAGEVTLELTDDGRPFDPLAAPPPDLSDPERPAGGLGIHLALSLVDAARYERRGAHNVLTVSKRLG
jgi:anti-sigma regulatory factor (Ser/Thr protein kinase)